MILSKSTHILQIRVFLAALATFDNIGILLELALEMSAAIPGKRRCKKRKRKAEESQLH